MFKPFQTIKLFLAICLYLQATQAFSQANLVPNPSFEELIKCPDSKMGNDSSTLRDAKDWYAVIPQTVNLFNACNKEKSGLSVPLNMYGEQEANTGHGYIGLLTGEWNWYAAVRLKQALVKGKTYIVSMYVSLCDADAKANMGKFTGLPYFGYCLTQYKIGPMPYNYHTAIEGNDSGVFRMDTLLQSHGLKESGKLYGDNRQRLSGYEDWMHVSGEYLAAGMEQYLIIGSFINTGKLLKQDEKSLLNIAYYVDDVSVVVSDTAGPKIVSSFFGKLLPEKSVDLKNIFFVPHRAAFLAQSFKELRRLVGLMQNNPAISIEIAAHTDNTGAEAASLKLSEERARAIRDYLIAQGIDPSRISAKGYGGSKPRASNKTPQGRKQNSRIEMIVHNEKM